ncbi:MAG: hypothetical protein UR25_C0004G0061 [Candidatus Nomurabacteria bacterium GW2011_GWE1_32_28]|uniref:DUF192 domain-containing protein n=1 Tax=Candidatus Nomurabacteria bacterium GW2011_GWF1_31_48 TaxID=1618767 RepID=A0A0F9YUN3_9BACT|nr:MAG: hypothetical protein UR10_C0004G0061 [Candidatus Nomurabacteria bacterium GW2011_GWF2_30_133]KKP28595.1 MAG: hypothetical protein UR18_C0002G0007 [Candidatus Nomurabacteria bacterium GW2011_GWE2_31_40]KKP30171.1 MAG: hypothetical protein UR19_C0003G0007 [Candidatus Nomurabacteria bacterium GW2011_GWF1_31_48]KKP34697.1 MAG: hypothetical protein UR25_C0004G0061 [Candidatus Nomurabacteria bacterium GW2011_GWE1_32_28]HAS80844.1 hypothetical protein [Candidatus Nomurabacteria bacterium]
MFSKNNLSVLLVVIIFIIGFFLVTENNNFTKTIEIKNLNYIRIAEKTLKVELALTPEAQERGLSGRKELKEDESMLFVFDHADKYAFWMKDMNFPIDIIWISDDFKVVYIKKDAKPESYPESFAPSNDSKYVLEVFSSFSEKNNLKEGDMVEFLSS